jgi:hypothetical protein
MSGSPKEKLQLQTEERESEEHAEDQRELYLQNGRKLVLSEQGADQLVEIRNESGLLEVRIRLTEEGPVLQMESARLSLRAAEAVEISSKRIEVKATETLALEGEEVSVHAEKDATVGADNDVRVVGKMIYLN